MVADSMQAAFKLILPEVPFVVEPGVVVNYLTISLYGCLKMSVTIETAGLAPLFSTQ